MEEIGTKTRKKMQANRVLKKGNINVLHSININKKTLQFDNVEVSKKEFHASKQPIALNLVNVDQILISDKFEHNDKVFKYSLATKMIISLNRFALFCLK